MLQRSGQPSATAVGLIVFSAATSVPADHYVQLSREGDAAVRLVVEGAHPRPAAHADLVHELAYFFSGDANRHVLWGGVAVPSL